MGGYGGDDIYQGIYQSFTSWYRPYRVSSTQGSESLDGTTAQDDDETAATDKSSARDESQGNLGNNGFDKIVNVFDSRYSGESSFEDHTADLTVVMGPKTERKPLFRWV